MILVLSFFVFIMIFFIVGLFFGKIKLNIKNVHFKMTQNQVYEKDYCINFGIYLFGKIKVFSLNFKDNKIKVMGKRIKSVDMLKEKIYEQMVKSNFEKFDRKVISANIKDVNLKFEKFNLNLSLGTDSTLITSFFIFVISTLVSIIVKKGVSKYNPKKHSFIITPKYENYILLNVDLNSIISVKISDIINVILKINKIAKDKEFKNNLINKNKQYPGYV